jgi:hypothetical protein
MTSARSWLVLVALAVVSACGPSLATDRPHMGVSNGTTLVVTLFVNGNIYASYAPGDPGPAVVPSSLPPLPWKVEARSPTGRVLTTMDVAVGSVTSTMYPDGHEERRGTTGRVDLSCGPLMIWAGDQPPGGPPPRPSPGVPGDCAP